MNKIHYDDRAIIKQKIQQEQTVALNAYDGHVTKTRDVNERQAPRDTCESHTNIQNDCHREIKEQAHIITINTSKAQTTSLVFIQIPVRWQCHSADVRSCDRTP